ncbi:hypothetical protein DFH09DRAFT_1073744 [Mycena vulgaris]|nr:hypothetical protein DFH09DRAFT_1073744 [Mycena vulgaris]
MSPPTRPRLNGLIQDAVRKASKFSIVSMKDSIERLGLSTLINSSTDEAIERFHLLGELTLQRCFVNHICQRAPRHRKAGYYSVMRFAILCQETQALIMSHSDMQTLGGSSAVLADALAILLGAMSEAVDFPAVSAWYERAFGPVTNAADEAYVSYW